MGCLSDLIGVRWCGAATLPPSSLYINDLPGGTLDKLRSLADSEHKTFMDVWSKIQTRAENRFSLDVREAMNRKYKISSITSGINIGKVPYDEYNAVIVTGQTGFTIELSQVDQYTPSPLMNLFVQSVSWYCGDANDIGESLPLEIKDLNTLQVLYSGSHEITQGGWNDFEIYQSFYPNSLNPQPLRIQVAFTPNALTTAQIELPNTMQYGGCCDARVGGTESDYLNGITSTFNLSCSWDGLICQNKNLFARAFQYLCGVELMTEIIYTDALNKYTTVNLNKARELRVEYELEYQRSLKQVAEGMELDCDCCLECNDSVQIRTATQFE